MQVLCDSRQSSPQFCTTSHTAEVVGGLGILQWFFVIKLCCTVGFCFNRSGWITMYNDQKPPQHEKLLEKNTSRIHLNVSVFSLHPILSPPPFSILSLSFYANTDCKRLIWVFDFWFLCLMSYVDIPRWEQQEEWKQTTFSSFRGF